MSRAGTKRGQRDLLLPAAVLILLIVSVVPSRYLTPLNWFSELLRVASAPISHPMRGLSSWLRPAVPPQAVPDQVLFLEQEAESWRTLYLREQRENRMLRTRIEEYQRGVAINPSLQVRQVTAPVIGTSSDLSSGSLTVRAGRGAGVEINTVVVVEGTQLLGKIERVGPMTSQVRPMTDRAGEVIRGMVMVGQSGESGLACLLRPMGDGTLRGDVQDPSELVELEAEDAGALLQLGQIVRLDDSAWPASAQMFIIGQIVKIEPAAESPLRRVITVRPRVELSRVSEVMLRILLDPVSDTASSDSTNPRGPTP